MSKCNCYPSIDETEFWITHDCATKCSCSAKHKEEQVATHENDLCYSHSELCNVVVSYYKYKRHVVLK